MEEAGLTNIITEYVIHNKEQLYRLAFSYVKNQDDALEVMHESITKAFSKKNTLKTPEYLKTWFYRIIVNTAMDMLRKKKRVVVSDHETLSLYEAGIPDQYTDMDLQKALNNLPIQYRSIVVLRYFEDLEIKEIAEILNVNMNTVKTRLYKSLKMLRIQIDDERKGE